MKICYFANAQDPDVIQISAKYFANRGHEVHIISFNNAEIENVNVHYIGSLLRVPFFSILVSLILKIRTIKKLIKEIKPDIIHGHYLIDYGFFSAASRFKPLIVSAWGSDVLVAPKKSKISNIIVRFVIKRADIIHSVSNQLTKELVLLGADKEKIVTFPFGINTKKFNHNVNSYKIRKSLNWDNNPIVISTRNFKSIYNIECLINAIPIVVKEIPNAKFILVGKGTLENKLKNMAEELEISNSIKFTGHVQKEEMPEYLSCADVYVSTSLSDGTSASLLEAMSCGLLIVVTNIEANKPWIKNGENGYLFKKKDPKSLADKIIYLLENKDIKERFGEINRRIIEEKADFLKEMLKTEKLYKKLTGEYIP